MKSLKDKKQIEAILSRLDRLQESTVPRWGIMTANQMLCHLSDQLRCALGEKNAKDISNWRLRTIGRYWGLWNIPIPKGIRTIPEMHAGSRGTKVTTFENDLSMLKEHITKMHEGLIFDPHPAFGKLSVKQWNRLGWVHIDYHLNQFGL